MTVLCDNCSPRNQYTADKNRTECRFYQPITNDEWRKTCSTEEFAEWISNLAYACMRCGMSNGEAYCHTGHCIQDEEDTVEWLKEKHNESV